MHHSLLALALLACVPGAAPSSAPDTSGTSPRPPALQEDRIRVAEAGVVDALVVVDPTEPEAVARFVDQFPLLLDTFVSSGLDWRIGVVSGDLDGPDAGLLAEVDGARWVDGDRTHPSELLGALATTPGPGTRSQPTGAVWQALELHATDNGGFLRPDSALRVLVVGTGDDDTDPANLPSDGFDAWFSTLRSDPELRSVSCLVTAPVTGDCADTAEATGGLSVDLDGLEAVALHATALTRRFPLTRRPEAGSLDVEVESDGVVLRFDGAADWTYDPVGNAIVFREFVPGPLDTVVVRYRPS